MPESDKELSGRELSAAVAERVFGEPRPPVPPMCQVKYVYGSPKRAWVHMHSEESPCGWAPCWYAEHVDSAMEVVENMRRRGMSVELRANSYNVSEREWRASFYMHGRTLQDFHKYSRSLPEAICHAALAAIETGKHE